MLTTNNETPPISHRQDGEIAGRANLRPNRLGSVKMPYDDRIQNASDYKRVTFFLRL